jgi:hypothetical protein
MALVPLPIPLTSDSSRSVSVAKPHFVAREPLRFEFITSGVDVSVSHDLGRIPAGYIVVGCSAAVQVYDGFAAPSESLLTLRASGAATALVLPL